jgi:SnoaL-like domain
MSDAQAFVETWSSVWNGADSDAELYMGLLHERCPLINPLNPIEREDLPQFMAGVLQIEPDIRVEPVRWAETEDGVLIEWVNRGTVGGAAVELYGADRFTLREGKGAEGRSYFDPRPFLDAGGEG